MPDIAHLSKPLPADPSQAVQRLSRLDKIGIFISSICLVHCVALPLLIALLPAVDAILPGDRWVHPLLIGMAVPITGAALLRGYQLHRDGRPAMLGIVGLGLISAALLTRGFGASEATLTVLGGVLVACAHVMNLRGDPVPSEGRGHAH